MLRRERSVGFSSDSDYESSDSDDNPFRKGLNSLKRCTESSIKVINAEINHENTRVSTPLNQLDEMSDSAHGD